MLDIDADDVLATAEDDLDAVVVPDDGGLRAAPERRQAGEADHRGGGPDTRPTIVTIAAAYSALLLGAAVVFVGDLIPERLAQAKSFGCEPIDVSKGDPKDQIQELPGEPEVDAAVDVVGFEARGHGADADHQAPATVLNSIMDITRRAASSASRACM